MSISNDKEKLQQLLLRLEELAKEAIDAGIMDIPSIRVLYDSIDKYNNAIGFPNDMVATTVQTLGTTLRAARMASNGQNMGDITSKISIDIRPDHYIVNNGVDEKVVVNGVVN